MGVQLNMSHIIYTRTGRVLCVKDCGQHLFFYKTVYHRIHLDDPVASVVDELREKLISGDPGGGDGLGVRVMEVPGEEEAQRYS